MMHAAPPETRRPLLALVAGLTLLILLGAVLLVASSRVGGETQAASQATGVPQDTPGPQSVCEERVVALLEQYAQDYYGGGITLTPEQVAVTTQRQRAIFLGVMDDYSLMISRGTDKIRAIQAVNPRIEQGCAQATGSDR